MRLNTSSAIVTFAKELEKNSADYYEGLAKMDMPDGDFFLSLAKENLKNIKQIERAYYGVITDAIEGCFAFDLSKEDYTFNVTLKENPAYCDALQKAIEMEEKISNFYLAAAEQSKSLLADIPQVFFLIARKRNNRKLKLMSLYEGSCLESK
ncbi:MAG: hypothetical protein AB1556_12430 [Bacillota bacterium]